MLHRKIIALIVLVVLVAAAAITTAVLVSFKPPRERSDTSPLTLQIITPGAPVAAPQAPQDVTPVLQDVTPTPAAAPSSRPVQSTTDLACSRVLLRGASDTFTPEEAYAHCLATPNASGNGPCLAVVRSQDGQSGQWKACVGELTPVPASTSDGYRWVIYGRF